MSSKNLRTHFLNCLIFSELFDLCLIGMLRTAFSRLRFKESFLIRCAVLGGLYTGGMLLKGASSRLFGVSTKDQLKMLRDELEHSKAEQEVLDKASDTINSIIDELGH